MNSQDNLELSERLNTPFPSFPATPGRLGRGDGEASPPREKRAWRAATYSIIGLLLLFVATAAAPTPSFAVDIGISIRIGPPPLPVYEQPLCPGPGYIWTPGYWAYDPVDGYYWVPGTWVLAPEPGFLWTPGYWGWSGGLFLWHAGYWGPHVGYYGGVNYGFGYAGVGYEGGYWRGREFFYNRAVSNVNVTNITNVYSKTVVNNASVTRVSYNGGPGGLSVRPSPAEMQAEHERHIAATAVQQQHQNFARQDRSQFASVNHGKPSVMASARPGEFHGGNTPRSARKPGAAPTRKSEEAPRQQAHPEERKASPTRKSAEAPRQQAHPEERKASPTRKAENAPHQQAHPEERKASPARKAENAPHQQAHPEERKANPPAERKPEGREPEHH